MTMRSMRGWSTPIRTMAASAAPSSALSQQQTGVFRYLVDAYLSGEVVSAGDILQVRGRDNTAQARLQAIFNPYGEKSWGGQAAALRHHRRLRPGRARCWCGLVALGIKDRFFTVARPMRWSRRHGADPRPDRRPLRRRAADRRGGARPTAARHDPRPRRHRGLAREPLRMRGPRVARAATASTIRSASRWWS